MDDAELKNKKDKPGTDNDEPEIKGARPLDDSNLSQVTPGTPWGVAKPHIYTHARHALMGSESVNAVYVKLNLPDLLKRRIIGFLGNFGSGKTEVAVNFAMQLGLASRRDDDPYSGPVRIIDLDIVNPYFRSREAAEPLSDAGVEVLNPGGDKFWADLPIILPEVRGQVKSSGGTLILDVGGDDLGARVLSHIKDDFRHDGYTLNMVVNANRPFTSEIAGARKVLDELEVASGLKIGGLVANTHLMDDTTADEVRRGYEFTKKMGDETGIPLLMVAVESRLIDLDSSGERGLIGLNEFDCLVLPLYRFMLPPWRNPITKGRFGGGVKPIGQTDQT